MEAKAGLGFPAWEESPHSPRLVPNSWNEFLTQSFQCVHSGGRDNKVVLTCIALGSLKWMTYVEYQATVDVILDWRCVLKDIWYAEGQGTLAEHLYVNF